TTVTYSVRGPWSVVRVGGNTPSFTALMLTSPATYSLPIQDTTQPEFRAVSAFYHVNKVHDFMKGYWPSFTGMDANPLNTNVDISGNTCNAFYSNGNYSINFYGPQNACRAFSIVSDIVYHEYGHGISYRFYSANGANFSNGAMGEGNSDVWAMCINRDGVVGDGAYINGGNIRSYLGTPKVYPNDIIGEVHADGEIIAGAWWDVAVNTGSIDTMAKLFTLTHYDLPNGPNGTEGQVYHDVLISALMNDDDDANLGNGTPHFTEIVEAFARHGIYLLSDAEVEHKEVPHQPNNTAVAINAKLILSNPTFFDKLYLIYRDRYGAGTWDSVAMTNTSGNDYTAQIPGFPGGTIVDYYFRAQDIVSVSSFGLPKGFNPSVNWSELTLPYQYAVGIGYRRYTQDFEGSIDGWQLSDPTDNATGGQWVHDTLVASSDNGLIIQPGTDNTNGNGKCLVTGNANPISPASAADVDNGKTTVLTPYFDLPFYEPVIEYYRWYSNDRGSNSNLRTDYWTVEIHPQNSIIWKRVDYTKQSDQNWRRRIFRVSEFFTNVKTIQMRFVAEDRVLNGYPQNGQNVVEAAIDDFIIYEGSPLTIADKNAVEAKIYPNPADEMVNVVVPAGSKGSITLYDVTGRTITKVDITEGADTYGIVTSAIPAGTYLVLVQTQFAVQNNKVVISHN
ncbi:MAG: T9SS type A sorting domain-containing protein, partial [Taibaiella sp.]|nr:T9SS type A sorting domain-containing protein [Taibaiella sp.]